MSFLDKGNPLLINQWFIHMGGSILVANDHLLGYPLLINHGLINHALTLHAGSFQEIFCAAKWVTINQETC